MSYDIYLDDDPCPACGRGRDLNEEGFHWNYTSNCAVMWRKAMPTTDGLAGFHKMIARQAAPKLRAGIRRMEKSSNKYRALNPENGWGDFDSQLERLKYLLGWLERYPNAVIRISR